MRTDFWCVAFSADGRALATAGWDSVVYVWEAETGKPRCVFSGHQGPVMALAFSPDGTRLVSGGVDTTALVWDLTGHHGANPGAAPLTARELQTLWADLASSDAEHAYRAIQVLSRSAQSVALFKANLRPVAPIDPKRQARLLADLDSNRFAVRRKAAEELAGLGEAAAAALRQLLTSLPSPETRLRAEQILDKLDREAATARLRIVRALEVLERLDTAEARELLRSLAKGAAHARQTEEAKGSLERLARRSRQGE
ncbi:MAG: hypothetical protein HYS12_14620 [Planctomycetes bacterium]|nr:hypothetical protein [Planctomycetota bacterium]